MSRDELVIEITRLSFSPSEEAGRMRAERALGTMPPAELASLHEGLTALAALAEGARTGAAPLAAEIGALRRWQALAAGKPVGA